MNLLFLLFFITIPLENYEFSDLKKNNFKINNDKYIVIFLNGWNCSECISKITDFMMKNEIPQEQIYFVIESPDDIYNRINLKKLIEKKTNYYNKILFNPSNVSLNDNTNSFFLKYSDNKRTPAILIKSDQLYFYQYDNIFKNSSEVQLDSECIEIFKKFKK